MLSFIVGQSLLLVLGSFIVRTKSEIVDFEFRDYNRVVMRGGFVIQVFRGSFKRFLVDSLSQLPHLALGLVTDRGLPLCSKKVSTGT